MHPARRLRKKYICMPTPHWQLTSSVTTFPMSPLVFASVHNPCSWCAFASHETDPSSWHASSCIPAVSLTRTRLNNFFHFREVSVAAACMSLGHVGETVSRTFLFKNIRCFHEGVAKTTVTQNNHSLTVPPKRVMDMLEGNWQLSVNFRGSPTLNTRQWHTLCHHSLTDTQASLLPGTVQFQGEDASFFRPQAASLQGSLLNIQLQLPHTHTFVCLACSLFTFSSLFLFRHFFIF